MKIFKIALTGLALLVSSSLFAQVNVLEYNPKPSAKDGHAFVRHHNYQNRVLEYPFVREDDILWSKTYLQRIDLRQKRNHPLYFPTYPVKIGGGEVRMNLADNLLKAVMEDQTLTAYDSEYFDEVVTKEKINKMLFSIDTIEYEDIDSGELISELDTVKVESKDIKEYVIIEDRFFDKKRSVIDVRILGLCPVAEIMNKETLEMEKVKLFWVWFPDAREVLNEAYVFNTRNSSQPIAFDHMLNSRRFNAVIYKEENVYQDRQVNDYIFEDALQQLLESERIKSVIRDFEQDMWNN